MAELLMMIAEGDRIAEEVSELAAHVRAVKARIDAEIKAMEAQNAE